MRPNLCSAPTQVLFAIAYGLILSPMAYRGSVLDLLAAGCCCGVIAWLHLWAAKKNLMFSNFVECVFGSLLATRPDSVKNHVHHLCGIHGQGPLQSARWHLLLFCGCLCGDSEDVAQVSYHLRIVRTGLKAKYVPACCLRSVLTRASKLSPVP